MCLVFVAVFLLFFDNTLKALGAFNATTSPIQPGVAKLVVIQSKELPFVDEKRVATMLGVASFEVAFLPAEETSCHIAYSFPAVHLNHKCLPSLRNSIPTVTMPLGHQPGAEFLSVGLGHSCDSQLKIVATAAVRLKWQAVFLWTDDQQALQTMRQLSHMSAFSFASVPELDAEKAVHILTTSSTFDAVAVHCNSMSCYSGFVRTLLLWTKKARKSNKLIWFVTEMVGWKIRSHLHDFWNEITAASQFDNFDLWGIRRVLPHQWSAKLSDSNCNALAYCPTTDERTQNNLALTHDAIIYLRAISSQNLSSTFSKSHICPLSNGELSGVYGSIIIDSSCKGRLSSSYDILHFTQLSTEKIGVSSGNDFHLYDDYNRLQSSAKNTRRRRHAVSCPDDMFRQHFRVTAVEGHPFLFHNTTSGQHEGFVVDVLDAVKAQMTGFEYSLVEAENNDYGNVYETENGTIVATGMLGQIMRCEVDLAVGNLLVTSEREKYISFAAPCWLEASMSLLGYREETQERKWDAFFRPFTWGLWLSIIAILFAFSAILSFARAGGTLFDCKGCKKKTASSFWKKCKQKVGNSLWHLFVALTLNGFDTFEETEQDKPEERANREKEWKGSSRILLGGWFFFAILVTASYTANLTAFFISDTVPKGIQSLEELADQTDVIYGTVKNSAVERFFQTSINARFRRMNHFMRSKNSMVSDAREGYARVRNNSNYVFIWGTLSLEYAVTSSPECNTRIIGNSFNEGGYGFGMRNRMPYQENFTLALFQLRDKGIIDDLRHRWFVQDGQCKLESSASSAKNEPKKMTALQFASAYVFLGAIIVLAFALPGISLSFRQCRNRYAKKNLKTDKPSFEVVEYTAE